MAADTRGRRGRRPSGPSALLAAVVTAVLLASAAAPVPGVVRAGFHDPVTASATIKGDTIAPPTNLVCNLLSTKITWTASPDLASSPAGVTRQYKVTRPSGTVDYVSGTSYDVGLLYVGTYKVQAMYGNWISSAATLPVLLNILGVCL